MVNFYSNFKHHDHIQDINADNDVNGEWMMMMMMD